MRNGDESNTQAEDSSEDFFSFRRLSSLLSFDSSVDSPAFANSDTRSDTGGCENRLALLLQTVAKRTHRHVRLAKKLVALQPLLSVRGVPWDIVQRRLADEVIEIVHELRSSTGGLNHFMRWCGEAWGAAAHT